MPFASTGDCKQWLPNGCLSLDMRVKQKSANFLVKPEVHTHDRLSLTCGQSALRQAIDRKSTYLE